MIKREVNYLKDLKQKDPNAFENLDGKFKIYKSLLGEKFGEYLEFLENYL